MQLLHLPLRAAAGSCIAFFFLDLLNILTLPYDNASIVSYLLSAHFLCSFLCSSLHLSGTRSLRFTYMRFSRCVQKPFWLLTAVAASGDEGIRTLDPLLARQVLSQLSYTPIGYEIKWA